MLVKKLIYLLQMQGEVMVQDTPKDLQFKSLLVIIFNFFATGQQQPNGRITTCQAVDPGGDIFLQNDVFQLSGTLAFSVITGTGKWLALEGAKFQG